MYHQIENNLYDQEFLDTYCVGFDAEHMPEGAPVEDNFKDYVLGTYDGEPKTPEWAGAICGIPANEIRRLAEEIYAAEKVDFFAGQSTTKIPAGEMFAQAFYTLAMMHGGLGTPGTYASWVGLHEGMSILHGGRYVERCRFESAEPVDAALNHVDTRLVEDRRSLVLGTNRPH